MKKVFVTKDFKLVAYREENEHYHRFLFTLRPYCNNITVRWGLTITKDYNIIDALYDTIYKLFYATPSGVLVQYKNYKKLDKICRRLSREVLSNEKF
mgnify:CR=1 FL=1